MFAKVLVLLALTVLPATARASFLPIASSGQWTAFSDSSGATLVCGVQTRVNGGKLTLWGATDRQGLLRLSLSKTSWRIPNLAVPIVLSFANGNTINIRAEGSQTTIRAIIPPETLKPLMDNYTSGGAVTVALPEGRELPWQVELAGAAPMVLAMSNCADGAGLMLPAEFRAAVQATVSPTVQNDGAPPDSGARAVASLPGRWSQIGWPQSDQPVEAKDSTFAASPAAEAVTEPAPSPPPLDAYQAGPRSDEYAPPSQEKTITTLDAGRSSLLAGAGAFVMALVAGALCIYFVPFLVGSSRGIEGSFFLFIANLFFGWTLIGWLACLFWAALAEGRSQRAIYRKLMRG